MTRNFGFDLIEWQEKARATTDPKKLFDIWDKVCTMYDRGEIGIYELEEMKETINPALKVVLSLKGRLKDVL